MKKYGMTNKLLIILFIFLFSSNTLMMVISGKISEQSNLEKNIASSTNTGVTIYSLDEGITTICGSGDLENTLDKYLDADVKPVNNLAFLEEDLSNNPNQYIVLYGHSNTETIQINDNMVEWSDLVDCTTKYSDKYFILPTCFSRSIYFEDSRATTNVVAPFKNEIDYRLSTDFSSLAIGYLLENEDLMTKGCSGLIKHREFLMQPERTLLLLTAGTINEPARGTRDLDDVFEENYNFVEFMLESSMRFAIHLILEELFCIPPVLAITNLLIEIYLYTENVKAFVDFFNNVIGMHRVDYLVDYGTTSTYAMMHEFPVNPYFQLIYSLMSVSTTRYEIYSNKFDVTTTSFKREKWGVSMIVNFAQAGAIQVNGFDFSFLEYETIEWRCDFHQIITYNTVPKPPPPPPVY